MLTNQFDGEDSSFKVPSSQVYQLDKWNLRQLCYEGPDLINSLIKIKFVQKNFLSKLLVGGGTEKTDLAGGGEVSSSYFSCCYKVISLAICSHEHDTLPKAMDLENAESKHSNFEPK